MADCGVCFGDERFAGAGRRSAEAMDRGFIAIARAEGGVYLGWRLLKDDAADVGFDLYRQSGDGAEIKLNDKPLRQTTDFSDAGAPLDKANRWRLAAVRDGRPAGAAATVELGANPPARQYISIPFKGDYVCNRVAIADLNGTQV